MFNNGTDVKTLVDATVKSSFSELMTDNVMLEAIPVTPYDGSGSNYDIDIVKPVGKHNVGVGGSRNTKTAVGSSARDIITVNPQKIEKEIEIEMARWTRMSEKARQNIIPAQARGMIDMALEMTLRGGITTYDGKFVPNDNHLLNLAKDVANKPTATGNWDDAVIALADIQSAMDRATNISKSYKPDTLYVSSRAWSALWQPNALAVAGNKDVRGALREMGITRIFPDITLNAFDTTVNDVCAIFKYDLDIIELVAQGAPVIGNGVEIKDLLVYYAKIYSCGLHNKGEEGAVQLITNLLG